MLVTNELIEEMTNIYLMLISFWAFINYFVFLNMLKNGTSLVNRIDQSAIVTVNVIVLIITIVLLAVRAIL